MERRHAAPFWRASLGIVVTVIAAALLIFAVWRVLWLNNQAGNTLAQLNRERTVVAYERQLFALLVDIERLRLRTQLVQAPAYNNRDLRLAVDSQMAVVTNFTAATGDAFEVSTDWAAIQRTWSHARNRQRVYTGNDLNVLARSVYDLIYKIEDTSGLQYESNRYAQDLADMLFAKVASSVHETMYTNLIAENAQSLGRISIAERVRLSGLLNALRDDVDLSADDWEAILKSIPPTLG
ncbi:MAG TPA: hypothetical protein VIO32_00545, partial [Candidatus Baltobacteraceae bacterium]